MHAGIIAEYNPFHLGHAYHLARSRALSGADRVIVAMSGDFVQRGEPAMFPRRLRAKWALENGADMVLALPAPLALASGEVFALAGVKLLAGTGLTDMLCFGSECGDISLLSRAAGLSGGEPPEVSSAIRAGLARGLSHPRARAVAYGEHMPELAGLFSAPNDLLAVEYLRAIAAAAPGMRPVAVPRTGPGHDSPDTAGEYASASAIRGLLLGGRDAAAYLPAGVYSDILETFAEKTAPITIEALSDMIVFALRRLDRQALSALPDVAEGLENLIYSACREQGEIHGLLAAVKSRRYTMARLKRICMYALLGISTPPKELLDGLHIRVLGVRREAMGLLSALSERASLPVIVRRADLEKLSPSQRRLHELDTLAAEIAALGRPMPLPAPDDLALPLLTV